MKKIIFERFLSSLRYARNDKQTNREHMITQKSHKKIYDNKWITLWEDDIEFPDGDKGIYAYMERKTKGAMIIPMKKDGNLVMVKEHRYPVGTYCHAFPHGDGEEGETRIESAKRELQEETGIIANSWTLLGTIYIDPGYNIQQTPIYLAEDLTFGDITEDPKEEMEILTVSPEEVSTMIKDGRVSTGWTLAALGLLWNHQKNT